MANDTTTLTLTDFLLTRIAEDEAVAASVRRFETVIAADGYPSGVHIDLKARVLAECEAKRQIVEDFAILHADYRATHAESTEHRRHQARVAMAHLAAIYADHPDFRDDWRP